MAHPLAFDLKFLKLDSIEVLLSPRLLRESSILVLFTTRHGGVSPFPYDSLNLGFHVGDRDDNVIKNRTRLCRQLEIESDKLTTAKQVHGNGVAIIDPALVGSGSKNYESAVPDADALITAFPQVPLAIFLADCLPLVLVEPELRVIGLVHAGWKGMEQQIIKWAVKTMKQDFKASERRLLAFIGPAIGNCCYNVDAARADIFKDIPGAVREGSESLYLDLPALARYQLQECGLQTKNVFEAGMCTSCLNDRFFSHRRQLVTGRQAALAMVC